MRRRILVGTDLGPGSDDAIRQGEKRAKRDRAALTIAHVMPWFRPGAVRERGPETWSMRARATARIIEQRVQEITGRSAGTFEVVVEAGLPHVVLARLSTAQHALLVVGAGSSYAARDSHFGGVTASIAALGSVPLLVARPEARGDCVLAVAGGSLGDVLATAAQEAELSGGRLALLRCVDTSLASNSAELPWQTEANLPLSAGLLALRARARLNSELRRRGISVDLRVAAGNPESLVPQFARSLRAAMVVVAAPEPGLPMARSVSHLLRDAPCPVLIAKRGAALGSGQQWLVN